MRSRIQRIVATLGAGILLVAIACATNPVTGKHQLALVSEAQEIQMGKESDPAIASEFGVYDDAKITAYVDQVGQKMAKLSHRPNLEWHFRVLDSPVINAFALPGGYIYITRGILAHMNDEAELAVVVGHEIGHVTARHGVEQQTRQTLFGAGLGIGAILSPEIAQLGGALQQGLGLLFLKYGRDDETQADELGVEYSLRAGYDAEAGAHFFEVLDRQSKESGQELPSWLSTHPAPADRVAKTRALAQEKKPQHPDATRIGEADHKAKVEGMVFGDNPRQGFMKGNTFLHPGANFQIDLPSGWAVQNTPSALLSLAPDKKALLQMTLEKSDTGGPEAHANKVAQAANGAIVQGRKETIGGAPAWIGVIRVPTEQGGSQDVLVAYVQRSEGLFQLIGQAASLPAYQDAFLHSFRSLQDLRDPEAKRVEPNRVHVETIRSSMTLAQAVQQAGALPVTLQEIALLNNLQPDSQLQPGFQLKLVRGTFRPTKPGA